MAPGPRIAEIGRLELEVRMRLEPRLQARANCVRPLKQVLLFENVEHRQRGDASERIAGVGSAEPARIGGIHDRGAADDAGKRKTAGKTLGDADQIRLDGVMLHREHFAGPSEAGLHLIGDQDDAMLVADRGATPPSARAAPCGNRPRPARARR